MGLGGLLRRPGVGEGVLVGLAGAFLFLVMHQFLVEGIWMKAALRALAVGVVGGAVVGGIYASVRVRLPGRGFVRGGWFGALVALPMVPFWAGGIMRIHLLPALAVAGAVVVLAAGALFVLLVAGPGGGSRQKLRGTGLVLLAGVLLNGYPAAFLFFLPEFFGAAGGEGDAEPFAMPMALIVIEIACGMLLEHLLRRRAASASPRGPWQKGPHAPAPAPAPRRT